MQASELQEINTGKLIKEAERLRAMADTASIVVSDAEDCKSEDDSRAVSSVQASELQEINKLIKAAERLRAMADTAAVASLLAMQRTAGPKTTVVLQRAQQ